MDTTATPVIINTREKRESKRPPPIILPLKFLENYPEPPMAPITPE